jgi:REP element-mobilizing transposase RayT
MANRFTSLHVHVVSSTKNRERWLTPDVEEDVWRYPGGICRTHTFTALQIGGVEDHVHLLPGCPATAALSDFIKRLKKGESSIWASGTFARRDGFGWQDGYGAFSIGHSQIPATIRFIPGSAG